MGGEVMRLDAESWGMNRIASEQLSEVQLQAIGSVIRRHRLDLRVCEIRCISVMQEVKHSTGSRYH